jgi:ribonuclease P protein component
VLPARYRMTRSTEFSETVKHGVRAVQPDIIVHARRSTGGVESGPRVGFIVGKSVGCSVERHRVVRRLRHVVRNVIDELDGAERVVIRALPSSRRAASARLEQQLRAGLTRAHVLSGARR